MMIINEEAEWVWIEREGYPVLARLIIADNIPVGRIICGSDNPDPAAWIISRTWFRAETKIAGQPSTIAEFPVRSTYEEALADIVGNLVGLPAAGNTTAPREAAMTINEDDFWLLGMTSENLRGYGDPASRAEAAIGFAARLDSLRARIEAALYPKKELK